MKASTILLFILLTGCCFMLGQEESDTLDIDYIYAPNIFNDSFSVEESWEIHKEAYIKQLKAKGLKDDEIEKSMVTYEKDLKEFTALVKEQHRLATIQRQKASEQRILAEMARKEADEIRKQADLLRKEADELRQQAEIIRKNSSERRVKDEILREKVDELRKLADVQRQKAEEQRRLAEIQRLKAEEQRNIIQEWRKNVENILDKNITLSKQSENSEPIIFEVTSKKTLHIGLRAQISSGYALIEVYNPKGVKETELELDHKSKSGSIDHSDFSKSTTGSLDKTISDAEIGEWQIKISSQKADARLVISVAQYTKPTIDE